jgi:flagellar biosynthesis protein FlhF
MFGKSRLEVVAQVPDIQPPASMGGPAVETANPANFAGSTPRSELSYAATSDEPALPHRSDVGGVPPPRSQSPHLSDITVSPSPRTQLRQLLSRSGFTEAMMVRLQTSGLLQTLEQQPLHHALSDVGQFLRKQGAARRPRPLPARTAFLGTPGVGRTTALCKWLAKEVFGKQRVGRVLKAEFDRPNPAEGLAVFCEALGIQVEYYAPEPDAPDTAATLGGPAGEFLYADLPGLSLKSPSENAALAAFLDREKFAGRVLVLNAAYDLAMLRRTYGLGADLGATHVVFTHLDEVEHWGKLWDLLLEGALSPLFLGTGPSLTGDCEEDAVNAVIRKTLPGA